MWEIFFIYLCIRSMSDDPYRLTSSIININVDTIFVCCRHICILKLQVLLVVMLQMFDIRDLYAYRSGILGKERRV